MKRIAIYTRVFTTSQTTKKQLFTLREVAARTGSTIVQEFIDTISAAADSRPGLDACLFAARQRKFDVLYVYSIDRLGRSTKHLIEVIELLNELKIDLFFYREGIDTTTATGKCVFTILGSVAELERSLIKERVCAGLARAKRNGKILGRPTVMNDGMRSAVKLLRERGMPLGKIARELKCGVATVYKVVGAASSESVLAA